MIDTPRELRPHGLSGNAQPYGSRWLLKAVPPPVWTIDSIAGRV